MEGRTGKGERTQVEGRKGKGGRTGKGDMTGKGDWTGNEEGQRRERPKVTSVKF